MVNIYLIRHAESVANTLGIYQGITYDTPLSADGRLQAKLLAKRFEKVAIGKIIASPLLRTMETAGYIAAGRGIRIKPEPLFIETNHGEWEGKAKNSVATLWPHIYKKWQKFPSSVRFPRGEHFLETQKRVLRCWETVLSTVREDIVIVSHDNIIRIIIARILNKKLNTIWKFSLAPTCVTHIVCDGGIRLLHLGDRKHLGGMFADLAKHAI